MISKIVNILIVCSLALMSGNTNAQSAKERKALFDSMTNYEVTTMGVGVDGTKIIKVWAYAPTVDKAIVQAKKNAVHACIFRGLPSCETAMATPALCPNPNALVTNEAYFASFFKTAGPYLKFVNMTTDGVPSGQDRRKVKGGYKVALYVQVMYDNLRDQLEADGIIRKLSTGF